MPAKTSYKITCDLCRQQVIVIGHRHVIIEQLKHDGWLFKYSEHYCPECAKKMGKKQTTK